MYASCINVWLKACLVDLLWHGKGLGMLLRYYCSETMLTTHLPALVMLTKG